MVLLSLLVEFLIELLEVSLAMCLTLDNNPPLRDATLVPLFHEWHQHLDINLITIAKPQPQRDIAIGTRDQVKGKLLEIKAVIARIDLFDEVFLAQTVL